MDPRERFSEAAEDYAKYRPDYPDELVAACADYAELMPGAHVVRLDLAVGHRDAAARFDRFGIVTTWIDGNAQRVYFDDLTYTFRHP